MSKLEDDPDTQETARHWFETPVNFEKVKSHLPRSVAIFSDDDPWVPLDNQNDFRDRIGSTTIIEHGKGHFSGSTGTKEVPVILNLFEKS